MNVQKGQREKLSKYFDTEKEFALRLTVTGNSNYNFTCVAVDAKEKFFGNDYLISNQHTASPKNEICYNEIEGNGIFKLKLNELPAEIDKLIFIVTIDGEGKMSEIDSHVMQMVQGGVVPISLILSGEDFKDEKSIISFSIYRKPDWRIRIVASGYDQGLYSILREYSGKDNKQVSKSVGNELDINQYLQAIGRKKDEFYGKDYMDFYEQKISDIDKDMKNIYIVNAGSMNHGKSSLFNSLLNTATFASQDVRTTVTAESAMWRNNVYLIDTPGLNAEDTDDEEAFNAYRRANVIIYIHTAKIGELHKKELEAINKIKKIYNSDAYFWEHFCLVFTFIDSETPENLAAIKEKTLIDIKENCGGEGFQTFEVSNSRYQKGYKENKNGLISRSGIPELREYLQSKLETWLGENEKISRPARLDRESGEIINLLNDRKKEIQAAIEQKKISIQEDQKDFLQKVEEAVNQYHYDEQGISSQENQLQNLKSDLDEVRARWNRERY